MNGSLKNMKKNKLYVILSSLIILTSFSFISCGKEKTDIAKEGVVSEEVESTDADDKLTTGVDDEKSTLDIDSEVTADVEEDQSTIDVNNEVVKEESEKSTHNKESQLEENTSSDKQVVIDNQEKITKNNTLKYPIFKNITNSDNVNNLISDFIGTISNSYDNLNMNYKITYQDENFVSIYFNGDIKSTDLPYPSKFKATLNINIGAGTTLKLSNLISFDSAFTENFKQKLINKGNEVGFDASTIFDLENLTTLLNKSDNNNNNISDIQSYYDGKNLNVILSVPHALGDYIEIII